MSRFAIRRVRSGPYELRVSLPITGSLFDSRTDPQGSDEYYCANLDRPVKYRLSADFDLGRCVPENLGEDEHGRFLWVKDVVMRSSTPGEHPYFGMRDFAVDLAYVVDPSIGDDDYVDPAKVDMVGAVQIDHLADEEIDQGFDGQSIDVPAPVRPAVPVEEQPSAEPTASSPEVIEPVAQGWAEEPVVEASVPPDVGEAEVAAPQVSVRPEVVWAPEGAEPEFVEHVAQGWGEEPVVEASVPPDAGVAPAVEPPLRNPSQSPEVDAAAMIEPAILRRRGEPARRDQPPRGAGGHHPDAPPRTTPLAAPQLSSPTARQERSKTVILGAIAVVLLIVVGTLVLLLRSSSQHDESGAEPATTPTMATTEDEAARSHLLRLLPPGYPGGACEATPPPEGAVATVSCSKNADPDGPVSATYTLVGEKAALQTAFGSFVGDSTVLVCPGNIQSPGPWRRNATPQIVAGTLFCGMHDNQPTVAWTDEAKLILSVVRSAPGGPNLDQLYAWWSTHS